MEKVWIFDTTLRDGEQAPGASMSIKEKIEIAKALASMNVDIIEAGFPVSSPAQFEACKAISESVEGPIIAGLARAVEKDIKTCYDALKNAKKFRIHTFIATSPIHREYKLKMTKKEVIKNAVNAVKYAKTFTENVEFSAEDAARTEKEFLAEVTEAVISAGTIAVNIPDTVGYTTPQEFYEIISYLKKNVKNIDKAILSVHCHNDLGLAVANSLAACLAGARQIECTVNGIGERAGNAAMEEIVMGLSVRSDFYNLYTDIDKKKIYATSKLVSRIIGYPIAPNKAIVGKNAFAHESGIHQDGVLKNRATYEIMKPEDIGRSSTQIVLGRHSGRAGFKAKIEEMGFYLEKEKIDELYEKFLNIADKKKEVTEEDIISILGDTGILEKGYQIKYLTVVSGEKVIPTATVLIQKGGQEFKASAIGDGPVDATYKAINRAINIEKIVVEDFFIQSVSAGGDAIGQVNVSLRIKNDTATGVYADTDIILAAAKSYLNAINKIIYKQGKSLEDDIQERI